MRAYRYLDLITAFFVAVLILSNAASTKVVELGPFTFDGGTLLFPLAYIFGDVLTEVYGYARSRRVIWTGFACLGLMVVTLYVVDVLPPRNEAFTAILGQAPRIALGSLIAYWAGEFTNAFVLAKLKVRTQGRWLWSRTISSTLAGQLVDTAVFLFIAFYGVWPNDLLWTVFVSNYVFKVGVEALFTPVTYQAVNFLKQAEREDYFDRNTDFNPLALS
ncbi:MAG: queuosine precursor transporter [Anaerolineales bacterium]|nr:queuosine precursor transporter [Anaerolineales bacterium]